jgi:hypothetical protein
MYPAPQLSKLISCLDSAQTSILSVGSGDGSQQRAIVNSGHARLQTTFFDSKPVLLSKYPEAGEILVTLAEKSLWVPLYNIDATKLHTYEDIGMFDVIMFTFPHTDLSNSDARQVQSNRALIRDFLHSAQRCLKPGGQVEITVKAGEFYDQWEVPLLLQKSKRTDDDAALVYQGSHEMDMSRFPDYTHRRTTGSHGNHKSVHDLQGAVVHLFSRAVPDLKRKEPPVISGGDSIG